MQGFRTYLVALMMAAVPSIMTWLEKIDWVSLLASLGVPQQWAVPLAGLVAGTVMAFMRSITSTPPLQK